ncbi:MAG TPA: PAAR-like domain-containing protein, partial [Gemmatimonadota bacterium]|nr:PAAR-like domain-containing protein [Gemmatimonadota bacterium]
VTCSTAWGDGMGVTVNVNGLSLVHKGSGGTTAATVPDVCKTPTPSGPVPIPYPNVSFSSDLAKGSTSVTADGGNMIAIKGSEFSKSIGDEPGTAGGVKSGVNMKEAKWISYSFDVKIEGHNACRLSDKMTCNHGNTVSLFGEMQAPIPPAEMAVLCPIICACNESPATSGTGRQMRQLCVDAALTALDTPPGTSTIKSQVPFNMTTIPPSPMMSGSDPLARSSWWIGRAIKEIPGFQGGQGMVRIPDVVVVNDPSLPPVQPNIKSLIEIKFPGDYAREGQLQAYEEIAPGRVSVVGPEDCGCGEQEPEPEPIRVPVPEVRPVDVLLLLAAAALILTPIPGDEVLVGAGAAGRLAAAFAIP